MDERSPSLKGRDGAVEGRDSNDRHGMGPLGNHGPEFRRRHEEDRRPRSLDRVQLGAQSSDRAHSPGRGEGAARDDDPSATERPTEHAVDDGQTLSQSC